MALLEATQRRSVHPGRTRASHPAYGPPVVLRTDTGETLELDVRRWHDPATVEEAQLLSTLTGPVIDLGCGPGRLVVSLASRRVPALGVDSSPSAVALARGRGATVLQRDLFGPLPGEGRWGTALLFDGNIGIGGDPARLLARCRDLTRRGGQVLAEVQPPGIGWRRVTAWFERDGLRSEAFGWAIVGADAIARLAHQAGLQVGALDEVAPGRWFARLEGAA